MPDLITSLRSQVFTSYHHYTPTSPDLQEVWRTHHIQTRACCLVFKRNQQTVKVPVPRSFSLIGTRFLVASPLCQHFMFSVFWILGVLMSIQRSHCFNNDPPSPMMFSIYSWACVPCMYILWLDVYSLAHLKSDCFLTEMSSLWSFRWQCFITCVFCKYFLPVCGLSFYLNSVFCWAGIFNFSEVQPISCFHGL